MSEDHESTSEVVVDVDGTRYSGRYRVTGGTVIVYLESEIKFASLGTSGAGRVAQWLLSDLARQNESKKRRATAR